MQSPAWLSPAGLLLVSALCPFLGPFRNTNVREAGDLDRPSLRRFTSPDASIRPDRVMKEPVRCIPNPAHDRLPHREDSEAP